jgi:hypothetical protein
MRMAPGVRGFGVVRPNLLRGSPLLSFALRATGAAGRLGGCNCGGAPAGFCGS